MNEKDVKTEEMSEISKIQNAGLVSACLELKECVETARMAPLSISLLEAIRNNLEVYDCVITKKLIRRVQYALGIMRGTRRNPVVPVMTDEEKALLRMLLNELNSVIGFSSDPIR